MRSQPFAPWDKRTADEKLDTLKNDTERAYAVLNELLREARNTSAQIAEIQRRLTQVSKEIETLKGQSSEGA